MEDEHTEIPMSTRTTKATIINQAEYDRTLEDANKVAFYSLPAKMKENISA